MNIYKVVNALTSDSIETIDVNELVGEIKPKAYFINYECHGYGKFKVDK